MRIDVMVTSRLQALAAFVSAQSGQEGFEYMLVIGAVVGALIVALIGFELLVPKIAGLACPSVDTSANPIATIGSCLGS